MTLFGRLTNALENALMRYWFYGDEGPLAALSPVNGFVATTESYREYDESYGAVSSISYVALEFLSDRAIGAVVELGMVSAPVSGYMLGRWRNVYDITPVAYGVLDHALAVELERSGKLDVVLELSSPHVTSLGARAALTMLATGTRYPIEIERTAKFYAGDEPIESFFMPGLVKKSNTMYVNGPPISAYFNSGFGKVVTHLVIEHGDGSLGSSAALIKVPLSKHVPVVRGINVAIRPGFLVITLA